MNRSCLAEVSSDCMPVGVPQHPNLCDACAEKKVWVRAQRLMERNEVELYLSLDGTKVQWLIDTRQITVIRMRGEDRFDSRDLDLLIETYKKTAHRRAQ